jgi:hypothetical protein
MTKPKKWLGNQPTKCDLCKGKFTDEFFIDGKTVYGPWAIMCTCCHSHSGHGLGLGKGQKYNSKTLLKVEESDD